MTNLDLFLKGKVSLETAEAAHVEIHNLRTQLAKANEIISECWRLVGNDVDGKSALPEHVNALNERAAELEQENKELLQEASSYTFYSVKQDFSEELNKFAIEKKIEALESEADSWSDFALVETDHVRGSLLESAEELREQLRKEQE